MRPKEKRVVHFTESLAGGVIKVLTQLIDTQNLMRIETKLIYLQRLDTPEDSDLRKLFPQTQLINLGRTGIKGLFRLYLKMHKETKTAGVFHFHSSWAGAIGRLFALTKRSFKTFYSPHGFAFKRTDTTKLQRTIFYLTEKSLDFLTNTIIIAYGESEFLESEKISNRKVRKINHFIEVNNEPLLNRSRNLVRIVTVGRIVSAKRPDRFIKLANKIGSRAEFFWIGDGSKSEYEFEGTAITITGWINSDQVVTELKNSDIFVLLSDWEGLPFSVLEAMGTGLPVVLWNFPGADLVIQNGHEGYVCSNEVELVNRVTDLILNENLRKTLGKNASAKIEAKYSKKGFQEVSKSLYEKD